MLQCVRMSVGRTWRFVADTAACVANDLTRYRRQIDELKGKAGAADFGLPWPAYRSRLWTYMLNGTYQDTQSRVLVATLLPLWRHSTLPDVPRCRKPVEFDAFQHPFALTTIAHLELAPVASWPADPEASALLHAVLDSPLAVSAEVRDGVPLDRLPRLPGADDGGRRASFTEAGRFLIVSGLHEKTPDPGALAYRLASLFDDAKADAAFPLKSNRGAVSVTGTSVGLVLPHDLPRAGSRLRCLHHNVAALLGYMESLATLTPASTTVSCRWFQSRAATLLNHLYRRAPLPETGGIYRSRLPQAWIDQRRIAPFVNALTDPGLDKLPVPA
jgi:hypothetical protein